MPHSEFIQWLIGLSPLMVMVAWVLWLARYHKAEAEPTVAVEVVKQMTRHPHTCRLPGRWERRRLDLGYGSIVRCNHCGSLWEWISGFHGPWLAKGHWARVV